MKHRSETSEASSGQPLLAIMPIQGRSAELKRLSSSLFARFEKVSALRSQLGEDAPRESLRRIQAEEAMLKQILEWLEINPGSTGSAAKVLDQGEED